MVVSLGEAGIFMLVVLIVWVVWIIRIEFGTGMGNVWLRMDATGQRVFHPQGIWAMLIAPWKELVAGRTWLWWPHYWDLNIWVWLTPLGIYGIRAIQQKRPPTNEHIDDKD